MRAHRAEYLGAPCCCFLHLIPKPGTEESRKGQVTGTNSMQKTVVHIGVGKTGTTSLQENVFSRHPQIACIGRPNHRTEDYRKLFYALTAQELRDEAHDIIEGFFLAAREQTGDTGKTILLSDENISSAYLNCVVASRLKKVSSEFHILITIRNQFSALQSFYANDGRALSRAPKPYRGRHVSFDNWLDYAKSSRHSFFKELHYDELFEIYRREFGDDRVHILLYEDMVQDRNAYASSLAGILDIDPEITLKLIAGKHHNPRSSGRRAKYQAFRSRFMPTMSLTRWMPGGAAIRHVANNVIDSGKGNTVRLSSGQRQMVEEIYANGNARLAKACNLDLMIHGYPCT